MLSQEAELALGQLAEGAVLNPIHTTARELIDAGLAMNDWGRLALTEEGRRVIRRWGQGRYEIINEHVADISGYVNPMGLGPEVPVIDVLPWPAPGTVQPSSFYDRATRAAGVASGKTGIWPETEWVRAFMDAFEKET